MNDGNRTVLHILSSGNIGGIEMLCKSYAKYSRNNNIFLFPWNTGVVTDEMEKDGDCVIRLNAKQKNIIKTFRRIKEICIENNVQRIVIHHNAPALLLYIPSLQKAVPGIKVYMYAHSAAEYMFWISDRRKYLYYKPIVKRAAKRTDGIIAISQYVKSTVVSEMGVPEDKVTVVYNGVDLNNFRSENKEEIIEKKDDSYRKDGKIRIIFVGRLMEEKGVQIILRALAILDADFSCDIVGDGPYRQCLEELTSNLGIAGNVHFLGLQENISSYLNNADIFIHVPILEEGFGITIVEAMAAGLICICSRSGAIPEIIKDGYNGFLVEKNNEKALSEKLDEVIRNSIKGQYNEIRLNAIKSAKQFSIKKYADDIDVIFAGGGYKLIYVGRLIPEKGVQVILQGLALLPEDFEYTFVIVGDGPYRHELELLAGKLGIYNHIVFLGERHDVPKLLMKADVFIHMPVWEEGFGITIIEAMAMGLICVCSKSGAIPEIISDGKNGFIVDKGSYQNLADKLTALHSYDQSTISTIRSNASKRATDFSIDSYTRQMDELMKK